MNTIQNELSYAELQDAWPLLVPSERLEAFRLLAQADADDFFLSLNARDQVELLFALPEGERRLWMRLLAPDDAADVIQEVPQEARPGLLALLDEVSRAEVSALLDYAEDEAGGLMNPRYARLRPDMNVDEAIGYLRRQASERSRAALSNTLRCRNQSNGSQSSGRNTKSHNHAGLSSV